MSDSAPPLEQPAAAPSGPKPSKLVPLLLVLNLGGTGFAVFKLLTAKPAHAAPAAAEHGDVKEETSAGPLVEFETFVVNLNEAASSRYLKVTMRMEVANAKVQHAIEKRIHPVRDVVLGYLSGLGVADSLGAAAKDKIKADLIERIQELIGEDTIRRIYFEEFVVQ
jgi:flagellar protein FliL